jgi:hypothetical protein
LAENLAEILWNLLRSFSKRRPDFLLSKKIVRKLKLIFGA